MDRASTICKINHGDMIARIINSANYFATNKLVEIYNNRKVEKNSSGPRNFYKYTMNSTMG